MPDNGGKEERLMAEEREERPMGEQEPRRRETPDPEELRAAQAAIRKEKRAARRALPPEERQAASLAICRYIAASDAFRRAKTLFLYRAMPEEVDLSRLSEEAEQAGKQVAFPLCVSRTEMEARAAAGPGEGFWKRGSFGILAPDPASSRLVLPEELDLVICPLTAFDEGRNRVGMGAGYYDRFLARCKKAVIWGAAFEVQRVREIPAAPWDVPLERIVTEAAVYGETRTPI